MWNVFCVVRKWSTNFLLPTNRNIIRYFLVSVLLNITHVWIREKRNQKYLFFAIECLIDSNEACYCLLFSFYLDSFLYTKKNKNMFAISWLTFCVFFRHEPWRWRKNNQSKVSNQHKHKIFMTVTYCSISISLITLCLYCGECCELSIF